jgi:hypothetical protein
MIPRTVSVGHLGGWGRTFGWVGGTFCSENNIHPRDSVYSFDRLPDIIFTPHASLKFDQLSNTDFIPSLFYEFEKTNYIYIG